MAEQNEGGLKTYNIRTVLGAMMERLGRGCKSGIRRVFKTVKTNMSIK